MNIKKKVLSLVLMIIMALGFSSWHKVSADTTGLNVQMYNVGTASSTNTINPKIKIINNGTSSINLSDLKLRYYYTSEGSQTQSFWCDYASMTYSSGYSDETKNVSADFGKLSNPTSTADSYFQISFSKDVLPANGTLELQIRVAKSDWSNYTQTNDYSFNAVATNYVDWSKITAYINGALVYGVEPSPTAVVNSTISPSSLSFDKNSPADLTTNITFNGNTLKEIDNGTSVLQSGIDYTLNGSTVTIGKAYLSSLPDGSSNLTFKFSAGSDASLNISVKPLLSMNITVGNVQGSAGNVLVPINFGSINKSILGTNLSISYDPSQLELVSVASGDIVKNASVNFSYDTSVAGRVNILFCDESFGSNLITSNGVFANLTFKIKGTSTVKVPVTVADETVADINADAISATTADGSVTITK